MIPDYPILGLPKKRVAHKLPPIVIMTILVMLFTQIKANSKENIYPVDRSSARYPYNISNQKAPQKIVGKVTDASGAPLPGVSIRLKGASQGTMSDKDGQYTITVPDQQSVLIFSFVGYDTIEVQVGSQNTLNVVLQENKKSLNEIVVVGYGAQKKANLTGAVTSVKMATVLGDRPVANAAEALQGAASGLQITAGSGQPGTAPAINVRGFTSINGGSPLVLLDNVPTDINTINPQDIDNISVLKDASASAIYGARAAFGVVLITTKKGLKNQPLKFEYSANLANTSASTMPEKASPNEFVNALKQIGNTTYWTGQNIDTWLDLLNKYQQNPSQYPNGYETVNNLRYSLSQEQQYNNFFTGGFEQLHNFSASGGSEKTSFRISTAYANQDGIVTSKADDFKKWNFNALLNTALTEKLNFNVNVLYNNVKQNTPYNYSQLFYNLLTFPSFAPTGMATLTDGSSVAYSSSDQVVQKETPRNNFNDYLRLSGRLEFTPVKNLKITGEYTFNHSNENQVDVNNNYNYQNPVTFAPITINSASSYVRNNSLTNYQTVNLYANYSLNIAESHHFDFLLGTNQESSKQQGFSASRLNLLSPSVPSLSTSTGTISGGDNFNEFAISGYFGRLNYNYKGRYLLEANARYDGSSRFPTSHQFGLFPSFSAGWNLTEEPFMKGLTQVLSLLKIRGSYGSIGNQVLLNADGSQNYYPAIAGLTTGLSNWIDPATNIRYSSLNPPPLISSNFTWERVQTRNFGADISFLNNKLSGSVDFYTRKTLGMLVPGAPLPSVLGTAAPTQNAADLKTVGVETQLTWSDQSHPFKYSIGVNLSNNNAFITNYRNPAGLLSTYYTDQRLGDIWGYVTQGYFKESDFVSGSLNANKQNGQLLPGIAPYKGEPVNPGDIRFADLNNDGVIFSGNNTLTDPGDRKIIGNNNRRYQYGINGSMSYKNFDISFFIQGIGKRDIWISNFVYFPYQTQFVDIFKNQMDFWTPTNTEAYYPRLYPNAGGNSAISQSVQTKYLANGAYLRVKNITMGYSLPASWVKKLSLARTRIFFSGENLFTHDHLPAGLDPEATNLGSGGIYPFIKKFSFGLNVTF
jgi:TonB-linked SusC/RagA family outer membrane protein